MYRVRVGLEAFWNKIKVWVSLGLGYGKELRLGSAYGWLGFGGFRVRSGFWIR